MTLIALLIGLIIERLATQIFHWRRMRWMDRIIDFGFHQAERLATWPAIIPVVLLGIVLVLPIFAVIWFLGDTLAGFTYLLLAVVVLFFSLGPSDIGEEVGDYCAALEADDEAGIHNAAKAIVEDDVPDGFETAVSDAPLDFIGQNALIGIGANAGNRWGERGKGGKKNGSGGGGRGVHRRRAGRLQHAQGRTRAREFQIAVHHHDFALAALDPGRSRVIPYRLLARVRLDADWPGHDAARTLLWRRGRSDIGVVSAVTPAARPQAL